MAEAGDPCRVAHQRHAEARHRQVDHPRRGHPSIQVSISVDDSCKVNCVEAGSAHPLGLNSGISTVEKPGLATPKGPLFPHRHTCSTTISSTMRRFDQFVSNPHVLNSLSSRASAFFPSPSFFVRHTRTRTRMDTNALTRARKHIRLAYTPRAHRHTDTQTRTPTQSHTHTPTHPHTQISKSLEVARSGKET